jgi:ADP-ribose pyrophosphatase YjhB (NUDIX family)
MVMKYIIASGPVIIEDGKLLVNKDNKDSFYKLPGGRVHEGEGLKECCIRETKEENNGSIKIIKPLSPMILWKNPETKEKMCIILVHYEAKLVNKRELKPNPPIQEVRWLNIKKIKQGEYKVAPNIKYLAEIGEIK